MNKGKITSKRQEMRDRQRRKAQQERLVVVGVIAAVAILFAGILAGPTIGDAFAPVGEIKTAEAHTYPQVDRNTMGDPNAPVKITIFSDFQCSACLSFFLDTEKAFVDSYVANGTVQFTYRSMGAFIGPDSAKAAQAAYCAADQGKFWEYHDTLFANWTGENVGDFTSKRLKAFAANIGLNTADFNSCYDSGKYVDQVNLDMSEGFSLGVEATPTFIVNGTPIKGALTFENLSQLVEAALVDAGVQ